MNDLREKFEKLFPAPTGISWEEDNYYGQGIAHIRRADDYRALWQVFQSGVDVGRAGNEGIDMIQKPLLGMVEAGPDSIDSNFKYVVSDANLIAENLMMGAYPHPDNLPAGVRFVVSASKYPQPYHVPYINFPFNDGPMIPPTDHLLAVASAINAVRRTGSMVLVHCDAGLNRSGLLVALALMGQGLTARDAIELIRTKRKQACLHNKWFVEWLLNRKT